MSLLEIKDLVTCFDTEQGVIHAVNGVTFSLDAGERVGLTGESGSGKTVIAQSIMRLLPEPSARIEWGSIVFQKKDLLELSEEKMRQRRGKELAIVFQNSLSSLNPALKLGTQLIEGVQEHQGISRKEALEKGQNLLASLGILDPLRHLQKYPQQLSSGMGQSLMFAIALSCDPSLLIADEPSTALDFSKQLQSISLVKRFQEKKEIGILWITHDLRQLAHIAQRVIVMYAGYIVESIAIEKLYTEPFHPYTQALLSLSTQGSKKKTTERKPIPGQAPNQMALPLGCPFAPRCSFRVPRCQEIPFLEEVEEGHKVACWQWEKIKAL